jgi:nucleoside-diphosphate-sugar epimerase
MAETVLVTGATGFVGRHLSTALMAAGHTVYTHSSSDSDIAVAVPAYKGVSHVFHLAGRTFVPDSWRDPLSFYQTNVQGTVTIMEFCRKHNASATVLSSYVYGIPQRLPIDEEHPVSAVNPYGHTKILAEEVARFYAAHFGLRVCIVRPFNLYGPGQDVQFLIPQLIHDCLDPETPTIEVTDLSPRRDYLHIDDLVALLTLIMRTGTVGTYNAGSGTSTSVEGLASLIRDYAGTNKPIIGRNETRRNEIPDVVADISRARSSLGWSPRTPLPEGIRELVRQTKAHLA